MKFHNYTSILNNFHKKIPLPLIFLSPCCGRDPYKQSKLTKHVCKGISMTQMWKQTSLGSTDCSIGPKKIYTREKIRFSEALHINLLLLLLKYVVMMLNAYKNPKVHSNTPLAPNQKKPQPNPNTHKKSSIKKNKFSGIFL